MSYTQDGEKKPGKIWYGYQRTKAIFTNRSKLGAFYLDAAVKTGSAALMFSPVANLVTTFTNFSLFGALSIPFTVAGAVVGGGALYLTRNWIKSGISDLFHNRHTDKTIQEAEAKWIEKKKQPGLFKRMGTSIKNALTFGKKKTADIDAPENTASAPKLEAANRNYESGQQSPEFEQAAAKAEAPKTKAVDPKAEERRQRRLEARNKRNNMG